MRKREARDTNSSDGILGRLPRIDNPARRYACKEYSGTTRIDANDAASARRAVPQRAEGERCVSGQPVSNEAKDLAAQKTRSRNLRKAEDHTRSEIRVESAKHRGVPSTTTSQAARVALPGAARRRRWFCQASRKAQQSCASAEGQEPEYPEQKADP